MPSVTVCTLLAKHQRGGGYNCSCLGKVTDSTRAGTSVILWACVNERGSAFGMAGVIGEKREGGKAMVSGLCLVMAPG